MVDIVDCADSSVDGIEEGEEWDNVLESVGDENETSEIEV